MPWGETRRNRRKRESRNHMRQSSLWNRRLAAKSPTMVEARVPQRKRSRVWTYSMVELSLATLIWQKKWTDYRKRRENKNGKQARQKRVTLTTLRMNLMMTTTWTLTTTTMDLVSQRAMIKVPMPILSSWRTIVFTRLTLERLRITFRRLRTMSTTRHLKIWTE
jgi:hypothetical protein